MKTSIINGSEVSKLSVAIQIKVSLLFGKDDFMCSLAGGIISWIRKYDNATTLPHRFLTIGKLCPT
ncbi:TPA: hypothetical protein R4S87_004706 [Kluyvera cryocrescens]|uniref:hypothetical protein n=1 Tax=Citrobacter freundii TaxID=546 RepID=UPI00177BC00D|nr:hypothetical protein [Citrobacter freundii]HED1544645.1 hypothetical protein [Kluyvera cryocrescens]